MKNNDLQHVQCGQRLTSLWLALYMIIGANALIRKFSKENALF